MVINSVQREHVAKSLHVLGITLFIAISLKGVNAMSGGAGHNIALGHFGFGFFFLFVLEIIALIILSKGVHDNV